MTRYNHCDQVSQSLIPRMQTPPALRKMYPRGEGADKLAAPNRNVVRKATFTKLNVGVATPTDNIEAASTSEAVKLRSKEEEKPGMQFNRHFWIPESVPVVPEPVPIHFWSFGTFLTLKVLQVMKYTVGRICLTRGSSRSNIGLLLRML